MNAVIGVLLRGADKAGALCATHAAALTGQPGIKFFQIKRYKKACNVCTQLRRKAQ